MHTDDSDFQLVSVTSQNDKLITLYNIELTGVHKTYEVR